MRKRPSARVIVLNSRDEVLLFRFEAGDGPERRIFWATPGGRPRRRESLGAAAERELAEETGLRMTVGPEVAVRQAVFCEPDGDSVEAEDHFFAVRVDSDAIDVTLMEDDERSVIKGHRWWSCADLRSTGEDVFPKDLCKIVAQLIQGR